MKEASKPKGEKEHKKREDCKFKGERPKRENEKVRNKHLEVSQQGRRI